MCRKEADAACRLVTGAAIRCFPLALCWAWPKASKPRSVRRCCMACRCGPVYPAHGLQSVVLPDSVDHLLIFADQDAAGMKATRNLRDRYPQAAIRDRHHRAGRQDWADIARRRSNDRTSIDNMDLFGGMEGYRPAGATMTHLSARAGKRSSG